MKNQLVFIPLTFCIFLCFSKAQGQPELVRAESLCSTGKNRYDNGQYQEAIDTLQKAIQLFEKLGNIPALVRSLNLQGESYSSLNQCDQALRILNRSLKLATSNLPADHPEVPQTYYYLARATGICARKIDDAIRLAYHSMNIKEKLFGKQSVEMCYDYTVMGYLYDNKELPDSALSYLNRALGIRQKELPADNIEIAYTLHVMAQVYENQSELSKSLDHHLRALKIRQTRLGDTHPVTLHSINAIGSVYRKLGNFDRALDFYRYALENRKKVLGENHSDVSCSYYSIANLSKDMSDYHSAIQYYLQGHRILENLYGTNTDVLPAYYAVTAKMYGMVGEHASALEYINKAELCADRNLSQDHPFRGIAYHYIGEYYAEINDFKKQGEYFNRAISIFHKAYGLGSVREGDILFRMAAVSAKNKRFDESLDNYIKTLAIYEAKMGKRNPKTAAVYHAMGDVRREQGQFDEALKYFGQAFFCLSNSYKNHSYQNPNPDQLEGKFLALQVAGSKGQALFELGSKHNDVAIIQQALSTFEFAMQLIDRISADYNNENAKVELQKESRKIYTQALETVYALYKKLNQPAFLDKAFVISERSRSTLLLENATDSKAKMLAGVPDTLIAAERDIKIELAYYKNELYQAQKAKQSAKIKQCEKNVFATQQKYDSIKETLEIKFPAYYELKYKMPIVSIRELQKTKLDGKTLFVEFFAGDSSLFVFSVTKHLVSLERKPIDEIFRKNYLDFEKSITQSDFILSAPAEADALYLHSAYQLYDFVLASTLQRAGKAIEKLIIIPDDFLAQLNFGILITSKPENNQQDYKTVDYLAKKCAISYAYSSAFINADPLRLKHTKYGFAGFAPSYSSDQFQDVDTVQHALAYRLVRDGNLPLPGAEEEVRFLTSLMSGRSWLNVDATETNFKQHARDYNILHLAMHSLLNDEKPEYSELLFNREKDDRNDGFLNVSEIYNLNLNADLVVLSSCNSGYGKIQKGEGPISISRAFSYAGCPSIVMSLWKVPDDVTRQVMTYFYEELRKGKPKDKALTLAQLKFVTQTQDPLYRHPHFWAGFVMMGDTRPVTSSGFAWTTIIAVLVFLGVVFIVLKRRKIRSRTQGVEPVSSL